MKKMSKIVALCVIALVLVAGLAALAFGGKGETISWVRFEREIVVQDGAAQPEEFSQEVVISKDGMYRFKLQVEGAPGMITGIRLTDEAGEECWYTTGESLDAEMREQQMEKGTYVITFTNICSVDAFQAYVTAYSKSEQEGSVVDMMPELAEYTFTQNGVMENTYYYEIINTKAVISVRTLAVLAGMVFGFLLTATILIFSRTDKKISLRYDERQMYARGKGFQIGFFTALIYLGAMVMCDIAEINLPVQESVVAFTGLMLSVFMYANYCIWKDAYFALNENAGKFQLMFLLLGIANLVLGIASILRGEAMSDGEVNFRILNLLCGILMLAIVLSSYLKNHTADEDE